MATLPVEQSRPRAQQDDLREFMIVLRQALLMVVRWIEKRYHLKESDN